MITISSVVVLIYLLCVFVVICTSIDAFQPTIDSHYNRNNRFLNPIHTHPTSSAKNQQYHHHQFLNASPNSDDDDKPTTPNYPNRLSAPLSTPTSHPHRSGFLSLIGAPNMGKSTLLNALLSQNLCTVTPRPQTTRHAILGVLTSTDSDQPCQLCFRDTPGVIGEPAYKLQEGMMEAVKGAFVDSDVILVVTDLFGTIIPDDVLFQKVRETDKTVIVVVNKIDLADAHNQSNSNSKSDDNSPYQKTLKISSAVQKWHTLLPSALAIVPLTASSGGSDPGVKALRTLLLGGPDVSAAFRSLGRPVEGMFRAGDSTVKDEDARGMLPDGPPLYGEDAVTDRTERYVLWCGWCGVGFVSCRFLLVRSCGEDW